MSFKGNQNNDCNISGNFPGIRRKLNVNVKAVAHQSSEKYPRAIGNNAFPPFEFYPLKISPTFNY